MMPSPPICAVISRMRSRGNGGSQQPAAGGCSVAGSLVDVQAAKTVRAMVAVGTACALRNNNAAAVFAGEHFAAGVCFVISFFKALQSRTPCSGIDYSMAKNVCQERSVKSQPVCILCRTGCRPVKLCILKFYLISRAIPHNSKCRYGERGTADAKPKAQIILCVLSSILATQMPCRSRRSGA